MPAEIPAARVRIIERIILAARRADAQSRQCRLRPFLKRYFRGVAQEDLLARRPDYLARVALAHRRAGERRAPGRALVSVLDGELGTAPRDGMTPSPAYAGRGGHR